MATLVLGALGSAIGAGFGGTVLGLSGQVIGGFIGSTLGSVADRVIVSALTPSSTTANIGARLTEMSIMSSAEGSTIARLYGRARMGTQLIWATQFKESTSTSSQTSGGKGGGSSTIVTTTYSYSISFAVAICEGNAKTQLGRVWLNGNEVDLSIYTFRFYSGSETQVPDTLIQAKEGAQNTSAYRGTAYIVFENMPLNDFGNRIPQVTVEVICPLNTTDPDDLTNIGKAFQLIPSAGEVVYGTQVYTNTADGQSFTQNRHNSFNLPDAVLAVDQLNQSMTTLNSVCLVVAWFGTDLRAANCRIIPKIESTGRILSPIEWAVKTYTRNTAEVVSLNAGLSAFGGTPSDATVLEMVAYLTSIGKNVVFYPFVLMDIPAGNTLPNPYSNNAAGVGQAVYPWRGRITCSPAIGYTGTVDQTATAGTQIDTWFNQTEGYRSMILHYATLLAGTGVDTFLIGTEMVGLTKVRNNATTGFRAVTNLVTLAADVSVILGAAVKVGYAADWSEYHSYRPVGTSEVRFNMDPLWASADIDFIGIDNYMPMSDWRDGVNHLDFNETTGPTTIYDPTYLKSNIEGGELYSWYYLNAADRDNQVRTNITDGAYSKPWVFRQKDIRNWWLNQHKDRDTAGVEVASFSSWAVQSKPIWFTEFGCSAMDKGTNQPNVFYDPKSSESAFPYNSTGERDDYIQRCYLETTLQYWRDNSPTSSVYADKMIKPDDMFIWTWDARPFPAYPSQTTVWGDSALWEKGHWLNGRIDGAVLKRLVATICERGGLTASQYDVSGLTAAEGLIRGFYISNIASERGILETLANFCQFTATESAGKLKFNSLANTKKAATLILDNLVRVENQSYAVTTTRKQELDLPRHVDLTYLDEINDFNSASIGVEKGTGYSKNTVSENFPIVSTAGRMQSLGMSILFQAWQARDNGVLALPPSYAYVETGDTLSIPVSATRNMIGQVTQVDITKFSTMEFRGFDTSLFFYATVRSDVFLPVAMPVYQSVQMEFMDLPLVSGSDTFPHAPRLAAYASPWPGGVNLFRNDGLGNYLLVQQLSSKAILGKLNSALFSGPIGYWDRGNTFDVVLQFGSLTNMSEEQLLASNGNAVAIYNATLGLWEVLQFTTASLLSAFTYRLSGLLRGCLGTEDAVTSTPHPSGSRIVFLDPLTIYPMEVSAEIAPLSIQYKYGSKSLPVTDVTYLTKTKAGTKRGLRPYSPADAQLVRTSATSDLVLTWKRRTRFNGDNWEQTEVPLNEETEQYQLEILTGVGGAVLRTVVTSAPTYLYTLANQTTDFGAAQISIYVQIRQYGAVYGDYGTTLGVAVFMRSSS